MLRRLLEAAPNLHGRVREPDAVLLVEVPGAEWVIPVADTRRILIHASDEVPLKATTPRTGRISKVEPSCAEFRRDGSGRWYCPADGNGAVRTMIAVGARPTASAQRPLHDCH
ncbi:hypothetical protein [Teichococcus deserti]|nr:hypothetical protein [Pseudoroseomonas deserti]